MKTLRRRISGCDWAAALASLATDGVAVLPGLLDARQRAGLRAIYAERDRFRSSVVMERYNYGRGEYRYFAHPLPPVVETLREMLYVRLAPLANAWARELGEQPRMPAAHSDFLAQCHASGQRRPTPLLRPRMQSRVRVEPLRAGDAAVFAVNSRPVQGKRGHYRVRMRHGVSEIRRGERVTLGVIFHDAA